MMFVSLNNSNAMDATSGAGTAYASRAPDLTPGFNGIPVPQAL